MLLNQPLTKILLGTIASALIVQICFGQDQKEDDQTFINGAYERRVNYACEGSFLNAGCELGKVMSFLRGNYGRAKSATCNHDNDVGWECRSNSSEEILRESCDGKISCSIEATYELFGDPCPGTDKYLDLQYYCVEGESTSEDDLLEATNQENERQVIYACESTTLSAGCFEGQMIRVLAGRYGRSDEPTCQQDEWWCNEEKAELVMKDSCDGKSSCSIEVTNVVFGDPCPYNVKYLEMEYECIPASETSPETIPPVTIAPTEPSTVPPASKEPKDPSSDQPTSILPTETPTILPTTITPTQLSKCDLFDLNCLDWKCPESTGLFPHPTNKNMFVSCNNWTPWIDTCTNGFVYSDKFQKCMEDNSLYIFPLKPEFNKNQKDNFPWQPEFNKNQKDNFPWKPEFNKNQKDNFPWQPEFNKNQKYNFPWKPEFNKNQKYNFPWKPEFNNNQKENFPWKPEFNNNQNYLNKKYF